MRAVFKNICKYACVSAVVMLSGCAWLSGKKPVDPPAPLVEFKATQNVRTLWTVSVPKAGAYAFSPALAGDSIYAAGASGTIVRINAGSGHTVGRTEANMKLTAGVGSDGATVAVAGEKGVVLAFDTAGKFLWKAQTTSEVLSAPSAASTIAARHSQHTHALALDV